MVINLTNLTDTITLWHHPLKITAFGCKKTPKFTAGIGGCAINQSLTALGTDACHSRVWCCPEGCWSFFPLIGRRNTPHTHNVACGSFGDLLHLTCLHHLIYTLPRSSLFALINMLKCRRIVKREKAMQQWHASARLESLCNKKEIQEIHIKSKKVIVDGSSYVEFECPAKKLQYPLKLYISHDNGNHAAKWLCHPAALGPKMILCCISLQFHQRPFAK